MANPAVHPYVDSATVANNKITLRVEVSDFGPSGGYVEVSGQATQVGGALAIISQTVPVPATPNGEDDDEGHWFVDVTADVIAPKEFRKDQNVTIFVRVARVWLTVLGKDPAPTVSLPDPHVVIPPGTTWDLLRADARFDGSTWPQAGG